MEALAQSITFDEFVATSRNFTAEFRENYAGTRLDDRDRAVLERIAEPIEVLAIVEDWCPDVAANLPILARIADDSGKIRLRVLVRDDASRDVADAYPYEGRSHVPTYVFSSGAGDELGVVVERTPVIRERVEEYLVSFFDAHPQLDRSTFPAGLTDELKAELVALRLQHALRGPERASFVEVIGELAAHATAA
ncbi:thioredoxin family protein [Hamadaea tsunoensis]|uniref:thioredoxin family protein n=1 Tax=Hamadaea tsunoensis TaxID=53368 RepID=UPI002480061E|nr:thioredoxin family protein [Hamadaea tsunoensis]